MNAFDPQIRPVERRAAPPPVTEAGATPPGDAALAALIERVAQSQDRAAFAALFKHFAPRVKAYFMRAGVAAAEAEEVAQDVMLLLWRKAALFDPNRAGAATWLFAIARNVRIDRARRRQGLPPAPDEDDLLAPSVETLALAAERDTQVRRALDTLSPEQQQIMQLSYFAETPHAAIAAALGMPLGTVKSRIRLAAARLRTLLEEMR